MRLSLHRALLILLCGALLVALVPAGLVLDRILSGALEEEALEGLRVAPMVLEDRNEARAQALGMHAQEVSRVPGLADALGAEEWDAAVRMVASAARFPGETPILVAPDGSTLLGPTPSSGILESVRAGDTALGWSFQEGVTHAVALAPVGTPDAWRGAAGVASPFEETGAATLAGLTRSEVLVLGPDGMLTASTLAEPLARAIADRSVSLVDESEVQELDLPEQGRFWAIAAPLGGDGRVVFVRSREEELAVLPRIRRGAAMAGVLALILALGAGTVFARSITRPVVTLAGAAERLSEGDFEVPLARSRLREVDRMSASFGEMRRSLEERLRELREANLELAERQDRLRSLQSELIQRDRLVASGRLVAELAHEIRNPVANIRNCLEVLDRRIEDDPESKRFAGMAIDELLRMHELAEQMLDLNRPAEPEAGVCDAAAVARQAAALFRAGRSEGPWSIEVTGAETARTLMPPDALKQVLMNLIENAREAMPGGGRIHIDVSRSSSPRTSPTRGRSARRHAEDDTPRSSDRETGTEGETGSEGGIGTTREVVVLEVTDEGPGVPEEIRNQVFDPFFTTKGSVRGVGLGLSVAEGIVRRYGGRISVENGVGSDHSGARFRIELLAADGGDRPAAHDGAPSSALQAVPSTEEGLPHGEDERGS